MKKKKPKPKPEPRARGSRRMRQMGHKLVSVWLDVAEAEIIERAAKLSGKQVATYLRERCFACASVEIESVANASK
jgi:hypothetical protein